MVQVTFSEQGITYDRNAFYQYDYGQKLEIRGLSLPDGTLFHFANKGSVAQTKISTTVNGVTTVIVPQSVLEQFGELNVYIYKTDATSGLTIKAFDFNVKKREKPGDYAPPDEPNIIQQLQDKLNQIIQTGIADYTPDPQDVKEIIDSYVPAHYITNNDGATIPGTALDAVRGKALRDDLTALANNYSYGSWIPIFKGTTTPGATTYTYNNGKYAKIGKVVIIQGSIAINTKDPAMAGELYLDGLPFPCNANCASGISIGRAIKFDMPTGFDNLHGRVSTNGNKIYFFAGGDNQTSTNGLDVGIISSGSILDFSLVYITD